MKVRSLKQVLHWLFLTVGAISMVVLVFSVMTYVDYAKGGYGLEATIEDAWLNGDTLTLKLLVNNPGGMDLILGPQGNLTMNGFSTTYIPDGLVQSDGTTVVLVSFVLEQVDIDSIESMGMASFSLNLMVTVTERDAVTNLHLDVIGQEVIT